MKIILKIRVAKFGVMSDVHLRFAVFRNQLKLMEDVILVLDPY